MSSNRNPCKLQRLRGGGDHSTADESQYWIPQA